MNRRPPFPRLLATLLSASAVAAATVSQVQAAIQPAVAAGIAQPSGGALERALESIRTENIRSDIFFIASDELGGRDTPSLGQRVAARYIRARLVRLGLKPGNGESYFHEYPLDSSQIDEQATRLTIQAASGKHELALGKDYFPQPFGFRTETIEGRVVFAGSGSREELDRAGVSGAWALCLEGESSSRQRSRAAREAGAIGVIAVPGPDYAGEPFERRAAEALERLSRAGVRYPSEPSEGSERRNLAQVNLSASAAAAIWPSLAKSGGAPALGTELASACTDRRATAGGGSILVENVCAFWPGSDPELAKEVILISAHYDHVGTSSRGIYNGADDNGSGTTGLMALAEALAVHGPLRRSVMLIWVSGEEKGLWGSRAWTENPTLPAGHKPLCNVNIDMIGRNAPDKLLITPTQKLKQYNGLTRLAEKLAPLEGFPKLGSCDEYWARSDQMNFSVHLGIPVAFLFSDVHDDYHQPTDDPEKIDCDKIRRVTRLVMRMLDGLQADELEL